MSEGYIRSTALATLTLTPSSSSSDTARALDFSENDGSSRGPASTSVTVASSYRLGNSCRIARWNSATAPETSTPVGPPPTTTTRSASFGRRPSSTSS